MIWENIYSKKLNGSYFKYPSEGFASIFFNNLKHIRNKKRCLNFGCGSGKNNQLEEWCIVGKKI